MSEALARAFRRAATLPFIRGRARAALKAVRHDLLVRQAVRNQARPLSVVVRSVGGDKRTSLFARMEVLLRALGQPVPAAGGQALIDAVEEALVEADDARVWLAVAVLTGRLPFDEEVVSARRALQLGHGGGALLSGALASSWLSPGNWQTGGVEVVDDAVMVDVDFTAKNDEQTGIQRVVRHLLPRWHRDHDIRLVVWTDDGGALRGLDEDERERVLRWVKPLRRAATPSSASLIVPWRSTLVLPEVPGMDQCLRLACLAKYSGNRVTAVAHDCIPVFSADLMPLAGEPLRFVRYLSLVKHTDALACVSAASAREFAAVASALPAQGLSGPRVVVCALATEGPAIGAAGAKDSPTSEVLVVGSHEPRKNHLAVLHAAELLWREGLAFRLRFIGAGGGTNRAFLNRLDILARAGRDILVERAMDDDHLWAAYRSARFTVFASLHEGYGLPVVESLALGTPVIGSDYGSIAEFAEQGGMVLVDPRDDRSVQEAMRSLLLDDERRAQLVKAARERPVRTWDDYAREVWQRLVAEQ